MTENLAEDLDELARELDRDHVFHSWSAQSQLSSLVVASGRGCPVWDHAGREYLDFSSQLVNVNIGHQHPAVTQAIREQAELLTTIAPSTVSLVRGEAAKRIVGHAPPGFHKVFFTNGGADANENAIRMARLHTGRDKILSTYRSYHGNTGAAIVATGDWRRVPNEFARGHVHFFGPYLYRSEFWAETPEQESERALQHLRRVIEAEGPSSIAAILLETIPGTAGIMLPPPGYLAGVRELADRHGILLIVDEVQAGFGRTGRMWATEWTGARPDVVVMAKGIASGLPLSGIMARRELLERFGPGAHGGTYGGNAVACAAALATLDVIAAEGLLENARHQGDRLLSGLRQIGRAHV